MKKLFASLFSVLFVAACGDVGTAMSRYGNVKPVAFSHAGETWRIYDKPQEGKLMITPTLANSAAAGVLDGASLGMARTSSLGSPSKMQIAAQAFVQKNKPACRITDGRIVIQPQREYDYAC